MRTAINLATSSTSCSFDSYEAAMENSRLPETEALSAKPRVLPTAPRRSTIST